MKLYKIELIIIYGLTLFFAIILLNKTYDSQLLMFTVVRDLVIGYIGYLVGDKTTKD